MNYFKSLFNPTKPEKKEEKEEKKEQLKDNILDLEKENDTLQYTLSKSSNSNFIELSNLELGSHMSNCWNGFIFHFNTKENIKIESMSMPCTSIEKPKLYLCENWKETTKEDQWKELQPSEYKISHFNGMNQNIITVYFTDFLLPCNFQASILIVHPNIWFLDTNRVSRDKLNYNRENEHLFIREYGWPMNNFEIFSTVDYYFIGSLKTARQKKIYENIYEMIKARDIRYHYE